MTAERSSHTTTMLKSGKTLATAGYGYTGYSDSSEIFDPSTGNDMTIGHFSINQK
jgi:hypothetical protein